MSKPSKYITFFEVAFVAADAVRRYNGEHDVTLRRFRTEAEADAFAATVQSEQFVAPGVVGPVPAKVARRSASRHVAETIWGW
jgi:hypothetical protein